MSCIQCRIYLALLVGMWFTSLVNAWTHRIVTDGKRSKPCFHHICVCQDMFKCNHSTLIHVTHIFGAYNENRSVLSWHVRMWLIAPCPWALRNQVRQALHYDPQDESRCVCPNGHRLWLLQPLRRRRGGLRACPHQGAASEQVIRVYFFACLLTWLVALVQWFHALDLFFKAMVPQQRQFAR